MHARPVVCVVHRAALVLRIIHTRTRTPVPACGLDRPLALALKGLTKRSLIIFLNVLSLPKTPQHHAHTDCAHCSDIQS